MARKNRREKQKAGKGKGIKQNRSKVKTTIVIVCILLIIAGLGLVYASWTAPETKTFDMYLNVSTYTGFNIDTSAIWFGTVPRSGTSSRTITLKNADDWPRRVDIRATGQLFGWVGVDSNGFVLGPGQEKNLTVYVVVPDDASYGNYTGKLEIAFRRVLFGLI